MSIYYVLRSVLSMAGAKVTEAQLTNLANPQYYLYQGENHGGGER